MSQWNEQNTEGFSVDKLTVMNEAQECIEAAHPDIDPDFKS